MASCAWHKPVRSSRTYFHPLPVFACDKKLLLPYSAGWIFLYSDYITRTPVKRNHQACRRHDVPQEASHAIIWSLLNADNGFFMVWPGKTSSNPIKKEENPNPFAGNEKKRTEFCLSASMSLLLVLYSCLWHKIRINYLPSSSSFLIMHKSHSTIVAFGQRHINAHHSVEFFFWHFMVSPLVDYLQAVLIVYHQNTLYFI